MLFNQNPFEIVKSKFIFALPIILLSLNIWAQPRSAIDIKLMELTYLTGPLEYIEMAQGDEMNFDLTIIRDRNDLIKAFYGGHALENEGDLEIRSISAERENHTLYTIQERQFSTELYHWATARTEVLYWNIHGNDSLSIVREYDRRSAELLSVEVVEFFYDRNNTLTEVSIEYDGHWHKQMLFDYNEFGQLYSVLQKNCGDRFENAPEFLSIYSYLGEELEGIHGFVNTGSGGWISDESVNFNGLENDFMIITDHYLHWDEQTYICTYFFNRKAPIL